MTPFQRTTTPPYVVPGSKTRVLQNVLQRIQQHGRDRESGAVVLHVDHGHPELQKPGGEQLPITLPSEPLASAAGLAQLLSSRSPRKPAVPG